MWFAIVPGISARADRETLRVAQIRSAPQRPGAISPQALAAERLSAFYSALGNAGHSERIVARLFQAASDTGVTLDKGEYAPGHDPVGRFDTYSITLPVKGGYPNIRRFCESVLLAMPYAALDELQFKRSSASQQDVSAKVRFTMFIRPDAQAPARLAASGARQ
ncbi:GspMb/PilO family protein [Trinickia sp. NRRL B-1857]|uniref:GspMb/PilO family protein n=1 Tax=Trinickia sp. NRRL B-1857 TaxID=3162879 RepID=UPI003D2E67C0